MESVVPQGGAFWAVITVLGIAIPVIALALIVVLIVTCRKVLRTVSRDSSPTEIP